MSRGRFLELAVAALIVLAAALYLGSRRNAGEPSADGTVFLPGLATELDTVSEIDLRKGTPAPGVTLHHAGDAWTVAQRGDYPADVSKVRKLLLVPGATPRSSRRKPRIRRTSRSSASRIPPSPARRARDITLIAKDGKHRSSSASPPARATSRAAAARTAASPSSPASRRMPSRGRWIDSRLIDVPGAQIQSVEEKPAARAQGYALHRLKPGEDGFRARRHAAGGPQASRPQGPRALGHRR